MILIRSKEAYKDCACEQKQKDEAFGVQRLSDLSEANLTVLLPESSNGASSSTGVTGHQIPRPESSRHVGSLGQVTPVLPYSSEAGMPTGSRSTESTELSSLGEKRERPLGVNALNLAEGNLDSSQDIVNQDALVKNFNPWNPEQQVNAVANQCCGGNRGNCCGEAQLEIGQNQREAQNRDGENRNQFSEARSKDHGLSTIGGK